MHRDRKSGFTLIELLVVIAIIAIIAALLFPVFARVREKGRQAVCLSNEHQIATAVLMYMGDYDGTFPFVLDLSGNIAFHGVTNGGDNGAYPLVLGVTGQEPRFQLVNVVGPYVKNANVWYCPTVGPDAIWQAQVDGGAWKKGATMRDQGTTYAYTFLAWSFADDSRRTFMGGKTDAILREPSRWPMLSEEPQGVGFTGNLADPPASAVPHSGGMNVAYGDGHAKFHRMEVAEGHSYIAYHAGDGLYQ
jgi:prepilin-type N-terminal cleavage/methylation domain-containing protein/prepilin-type processing-associated H-X9-DG protein